MMKQNKFQYLAMAAMSVCLLASCSSDSELSSAPGTEAEQVVRVTTNVDDVHSRAIYTTNNLDAFGMSIINPSNSKYTYNNVEWIKGSDGKWAPASQMLWQSYTQSVDIVAYAPYQENVNQPIPSQASFPFSVSKDQSVASDHSDFIVYKKAGFIPRDDLDDNKSIQVGFSHLLSQLRINVTFTADEFADILTSGSNPITEIKVNGTKLNAKVNFTNTPVTVSVDERADAISVIPENTSLVAEYGGSASYSAILVPQTIAASNFSVDLLIAGKQYSWKPSTDITLESGKGYDLALKVGKNKIYASPFSVSDWGTGESLTGGEIERLESERIALIMKEALADGKTDILLTLSEKAGTDVFNSIKTALTENNLADGSVSLTLKGVKKIPDEAFTSVASLKKVAMPNVEDIGKSAFANCGNLKDIDLEKSRNLNAECFANCRSLSTLKLGVLWSLVYSGEDDTTGNILRNVSTNNIDLYLNWQQGKMYNNESGNIWTGSTDNYFESSDYKNRKFIGMSFKSVTRWN